MSVLLIQQDALVTQQAEFIEFENLVSRDVTLVSRETRGAGNLLLSGTVLQDSSLKSPMAIAQ